MHSGGGYVQVCIDELLERIEGFEGQIDQAQDARIVAEKQLEEKILELKELSSKIDTISISFEKEIERLIQENKRLTEENKTLTEAQVPEGGGTTVNSLFLTALSDELRAPLKEVDQSTRLLDDTFLDDTQSEHLEDIQSSSNALWSLSEDLLDLARLNEATLELETEKLDLHGLIAETIESFNTIAVEKHLELLYLYDTKVPKYINGDARRIKQVFTNLLSSIIDFSQDCEIMLLLSGIDIDEGSLMLIGEVEDTRGTLQSMAKVDSDGSTEFQGAGLGLSISKGLLENMNGTLMIDSQFDIGTRLMFSLTVGITEQEEDLQSTTRSLSDKEVLLIIDNRSTRDILEATLKKWNLSVHVEESVREAFTYLKNMEHPCDLMILDAEEQLFDTALIAKPVKQIRPDLPMVLLRNRRYEDEDQHAEMFDSCLIKPVNPEHLLLTLRSILQ